MSWYFIVQTLVQMVFCYEVQVHCVRPLTEPTDPSSPSRNWISICHDSNCSGKILRMGDLCNMPFPLTYLAASHHSQIGWCPMWKYGVETRGQGHHVGRKRYFINTLCTCKKAPPLGPAYPFKPKIDFWVSHRVPSLQHEFPGIFSPGLSP